VLLDPRVFAKLLDAAEVGPRDLVLDVGCGLGYSTAVIARMAQAVVALEEDEGMAAEAQATLAAQGVDNAVLETGPLAGGVPAHGPYDAIVVEGAVEVMPRALEDQLKAGGRLVAIFVEGAVGQARLGLRTEHGMAWRRVFDAMAPVLPGFAAAKGLNSDAGPPILRPQGPGEGWPSREIGTGDETVQVRAAAARLHRRRRGVARVGRVADRHVDPGLPDQPAARREPRVPASA
jgi:protein-L-isoaspartate(D-aspartate) O-methyltransferase